uniref:Uncharacterized protein n=1 Tax=Physcomitrium patens TaxID=3218 RepID=A0A2K1IAV9_PHYPA|nr:hypothetical protein PHYPA_030998 [Physcomitrium patens]
MTQQLTEQSGNNNSNNSRQLTDHESVCANPIIDSVNLKDSKVHKSQDVSFRRCLPMFCVVVISDRHHLVVVARVAMDETNRISGQLVILNISRIE